MDTMELNEARHAIRSDRKHEVMQQLQSTYGKRLGLRILTQSRKDIVDFLTETVESVSIRQKLQQSLGQPNKQSHG